MIKAPNTGGGVEVFCDECGGAYKTNPVDAQPKYPHYCDDCIMIDDVFEGRTSGHQKFMERTRVRP